MSAGELLSFEEDVNVKKIDVSTNSTNEGHDFDAGVEDHFGVFV